MRCEAQIARFWLLRRRVSQSLRTRNPKPVSTGVENGLKRSNPAYWSRRWHRSDVWINGDNNNNNNNDDDSVIYPRQYL